MYLALSLCLSLSLSLTCALEEGFGKELTPSSPSTEDALPPPKSGICTCMCVCIYMYMYIYVQYVYIYISLSLSHFGISLSTYEPGTKWNADMRPSFQKLAVHIYIYSLSLSLSLSHTHTHTHMYVYVHTNIYTCIHLPPPKSGLPKLTKPPSRCSTDTPPDLSKEV